MIKKILLAYDGSESSEKALEFAMTLADAMQAELHLLAVSQPPDVPADVETEAYMESVTKHDRQILSHAVNKAHAHGLTRTSCEIRVGRPAEQIVSTAESRAADLIVVGHRGRSLFARWLLGSVAKQVMAYAHCPVTVVR